MIHTNIYICVCASFMTAIQCRDIKDGHTKKKGATQTQRTDYVKTNHCCKNRMGKQEEETRELIRMLRV